MSKRDFSNLDGEVVDFEIPHAINPMTKNHYDQDNFYTNAEGDDAKYEKFDELPSFSNASGEDEFFNALGRLRRDPKRREERRTRRTDKQDRRVDKQDRRMSMREQRTSSKADARKTKSESKLEQAKSQTEIAKSLGQSNPMDAAIAQTLATTNTPATKTGMSKGAKIGIAVGVVVVLGLVGYMMYKKRNTGK